MNFFKTLFGIEKKLEPNYSENHIRLFLDRNKNMYMELKVTKDFTCEEIRKSFCDDIYNFLSNVLKNQLLSLENYLFVIIDDSNSKFVELKLKPRDKPMKYIKNQFTNLYYLNFEPISNTHPFDLYRTTSNISTNSSSNQSNQFSQSNQNEKLNQPKLVSNILI